MEESRITLEYPNGRTYDTTVPGRLAPGVEFQLHGRRWRAIGPVPDNPRHRRDVRPKPVLCRSIARLQTSRTRGPR